MLSSWTADVDASEFLERWRSDWTQRRMMQKIVTSGAGRELRP